MQWDSFVREGAWKIQAGVRYFVYCGVNDDIVIMSHHTASTNINEPPDVQEYEIPGAGILSIL